MIKSQRQHTITYVVEALKGAIQNKYSKHTYIAIYSFIEIQIV